MKRIRRTNKVLSVLSSILMLVQPLLPAFSILAPKAFAQETTPTEAVTPAPTDTVAPQPTDSVSPTTEPSPTETISPSPTEEISPSPTDTVTPTVTPEETITPTPTDETTPTVTPDVTQPTTPNDSANQPTGPPSGNTGSNGEQGQILDGASTVAPTPTATPETNQEHGVLAATVLKDTKADTLDLTVTDPSSASLTTDKADYAPTDTVIVTGTGFTVGETYTITISSKDSPPITNADQIMADQKGDILYIYQLDGNYRPNYVVEVSDNTTNTLVATTTFTDSYHADYKHWADKSPAGWQNGALQSSNSQYFEGEVVPHHWTVDSLHIGDTYGFNIYYDYFMTQSGHNYCGFDYLAQYNSSRSPSLISSSPTSDNAFSEGHGNFYTVGANITNVNAPVNTGNQRYVQVKFTATSSTAVFYWGLHMATPGAVNSCLGAHSWPGASLQTDVDNSPNIPNATDLGGGGTLQINPSGVIQGTISGYKWNDLNGNGTYDSEPKLSGWTINLCSDSSCSNILQTKTTDNNGNYLFNVTPATYYTGEVQQSGWTKTAPSSTTNGPLTISATTPNIANQNFGNKSLPTTGTITIIKDAQPNNSQDFAFTGDLGSFSLDDDADATLSNTKVFSDVTAGTYTVAESSTGNWTLNSIVCTDPTDNSVSNLPTAPSATINLAGGESVTCTFTNVRTTGNVTFTKIVSGGMASASDWTFAVYDGVGGLVGDTYTSGHTYTIDTGSYSVTESNKDHYSLTNATGVCSINPTNGKIEMNVTAAGGTCELTNTYVPFCGDGVKNGSESCDGTDGVTAGSNFCTNTCKLIPIYSVGSRCSSGNPVLRSDLSTIVSSKQAAPVTITLPDTNEYLFEAVGDYGYGGDQPDNRVNRADAGYATGNNWTSNRDDLLGIPSSAKYRGVTSLLSDHGTGTYGIVNWGAYDATHNYKMSYTPSSAGTNVHFVISDWFDTWYAGDAASDTNKNQAGMWDNDGSIALNVYECQQPSTVTGQKYEDKDMDQLKDAGEGGLAGWTIFVDTNENGTLDTGEVSTTSDASGNYSLTGNLGSSVQICEVQKTNWKTSTNGLCKTVETTPGQTTGNIDFGNWKVGHIIIAKDFVPDTAGGSVDMYLDKTLYTTTSTDWTSDAIEVAAGRHTVSEAGANDTKLSDYATHFSGDCDTNGNVTVNQGETKRCTIVNTKIPVYTGELSCPAESPVKNLIGTHTISATDTNGETLSEVTGGNSYLFEASGTFIPTSAAGYVSDAAYTLINGSLSSQYGIHGTPPDYGAHALLANLGSGVGIVNWGTYTPSHTYGFYYTPTNSSPQFVIGDRWSNWYGTPYDNQSGMSDNRGNLTLKVYTCIPYGTITVDKVTTPSGDSQQFAFTLKNGEETTDTFSLADKTTPYSNATLTPGTYSLSEVVPDNWTQTSATCTKDERKVDPSEIVITGGDTVHCTFNNEKKAEIWWYKIDANLGPDESAAGHILGQNTWNSTVDGEIKGPKNTDISTVTAFSHPGTYNNIYVKPGTHTFTEVGQEGWSFAWGRCNDETNSVASGWGSNVDIDQTQEGIQRTFGPKAPTSASGYETLGTSDHTYASVNLAAGQRIYCVFYNENKGNISVTKYNDLNGNGQFDRETEQTLPDWTMNISGNDIQKSGVTGKDGTTLFDNLLEGSYTLGETKNDVWNLTNISCDSDNEEVQGTDTSNEHPVTVFAGQTTHCYVGNQLKDPILTITKTNNALGDQSPGGNVTFTITVTATQSAAYNVEVIDLPSQGFTYRAGSGTAHSSTRGDLAGVLTHIYASPGVWSLGNMEIGETVTITYITDISGDQKPGLYKDLALAYGCRTDAACTTGDANSVFSFAQNPGYVNENYAGTSVSVVKEQQNGGTLNKHEGEVLGAMTELPATGADAIWLTIAGLLFVAGLGFIVKGQTKRRKYV